MVFLSLKHFREDARLDPVACCRPVYRARPKVCQKIYPWFQNPLRLQLNRPVAFPKWKNSIFSFPFFSFPFFFFFFIYFSPRFAKLKSFSNFSQNFAQLKTTNDKYKHKSCTPSFYKRAFFFNSMHRVGQIHVETVFPFDLPDLLKFVEFKKYSFIRCNNQSLL